jgi:hypothetical protein
MGKLRIPKAKQIQGLRKALANRKTPRQFIPSLKKRLAKLTASAIVLFSLYGLSTMKLLAQTPVIIQPTQQTLAPAGTACTGSLQNFPVNNKNQSIHYASIIPVGTQSINVEIDGIDSLGNSFRISDLDAVTPVSGLGFQNGFSLTGYGYYPNVIVEVTCQSNTGTFTLTYSGSSTSSVNVVGSYQIGQLTKEIFNGISIAGVGGATSNNLQTPFGNSLGLISAQTTGGSGTGFLTVNCISPLFSTSVTQSFSYQLLVNGTVQEFPIPASTCPIMQIGVTQAVGATIAVEYLFQQTGFQQSLGPGNFYNHVTGTTATAIKGSSGTLFSLTVNTAAVGTISLFDLGTAACTGTPSTNIVAVITITATTQTQTLSYGNLFKNGICIKNSAIMDETASYQ